MLFPLWGTVVAVVLFIAGSRLLDLGRSGFGYLAAVSGALWCVGMWWFPFIIAGNKRLSRLDKSRFIVGYVLAGTLAVGMTGLVLVEVLQAL